MVGGTRRTKRKASSEDEEEADVDAIKREEPEEEKEGEGEEEEAKEGDNDVTATPAPAATFEPPGGKRLRVLEQVAKSPEKTTRQSPRKKAATLKSESPPSPPAAAAAVIPPPAPQPEEDSDDGEEIPEESAESWNKKLVSLLLYKTQYKSLNVSASNDAALRSWVDIQRKLYRRHKKNPESVTRLQKEQLQVLEAIEFPFTLKGALHWDRFYEKLKEYHRKHGHSLVPRLCEFPGLGDWVVDQRRQYKLMMQGKPSSLDTDRIQKLEQLDFAWNVRNRPEWNTRYEQLLEYKKKFGDTKVPQHYKDIKGLGKWVAKQREQYRLLQQGKHSFLTADRLEKLNDVGFVWTVRSMNARDDDTPGEARIKEEAMTTTKEEDDAKGAIQEL